MEYKLFNTDGKTFFDFRNDPNSRMEAFVITFCDDGTVVMTGDYGVLAWKRNYHHESDAEFRRDYGFPFKDTNISYFAEKICQHGIPQQIRCWSKDRAIADIKEFFKEYRESYEQSKLTELVCEMEWLEDSQQREMYRLLNKFFPEQDWEVSFGEDYTEHFKFMFECLKSVSEQIIEAVRKKENLLPATG